jgi:hypothetical protein
VPVVVALLVFGIGLALERVALSYALDHWDAAMAAVRAKHLPDQEVGEVVVNDLYRLLRLVFLVTAGLLLVLLPFLLRRSKVAGAVLVVLCLPFAAVGAYVELHGLLTNPATSRDMAPAGDLGLTGWLAFCHTVGGPLIAVGALATVVAFFLPVTRRFFRTRPLAEAAQIVAS